MINYSPRLSVEPIAGRLIYVRVERPGFRPVDLYLFTTLLDASRYTIAQLVELYGLRWHVELDIRYVKDTLDMGLLTGQSPDIVCKEFDCGLLAYNLILGEHGPSCPGRRTFTAGLELHAVAPHMQLLVAHLAGPQIGQAGQKAVPAPARLPSASCRR